MLRVVAQKMTGAFQAFRIQDKFLYLIFQDIGILIRSGNAKLIILGIGIPTQSITAVAAPKETAISFRIPI
jgi:hypothetical protein